MKLNKLTYPAHKSSIFDLNANLVAIIAYFASAILGFIPFVSYVAWLAPLGIFFWEKSSFLVKRHSLSAFFIQVCETLVGIVIALIMFLIPVAGWIIGSILNILLTLGFLALKVFCVIQAYKNEYFRYPVLDPLCKWFLKLVKVEEDI